MNYRTIYFILTLIIIVPLAAKDGFKRASNVFDIFNANEIDDPDSLYNKRVKESSTNKLEHTIYTSVSISNPYGKIKKVMGNGFGINLGYYIKLPLFSKSKFQLKSGAVTGLQFQKTKVPNVNAAVTLAPFLFAIRIGYDFFFEENKYYINPYFTSLGGIIVANTTGSNALQEVVDNTTSDLSFKWELGFEVKNKDPRKMSFFVQTGFILELQKVNGMYITYSIGTSFKF